MKTVQSGAFLRRLAQDKSGNVLAIMAAAFFPMAAVIGGSIDMARIYITKTRLQQGCDAGALAGRKAMGSGAWTTTGTKNSRDQANALFASNFASGDFGTSNLAKEFTEAGGTVTGTASATVPMTLMKIFGQPDRTVSVTCTAKMEIPNTDVMFVLDVTGSMAGSNMVGLKSAVKCFYEALVQVNTPEPCTVDASGQSTDPTATAYSGTAQIRLGFVPYSVNVNVGKLLPNAYFADEWYYQTRKPNFSTVYAWTEVTSSVDMNDWPSNSAPTRQDDQSTYSDWNDLDSSPSTITVNGTSYTKRRDLGRTDCNNLNRIGPSGNKMLTYIQHATETEDITQVGDPGAPVHPATLQTVNYRQERETDLTGYKYRYESDSRGSNRCRLQIGTRTHTVQRTGTAERRITWETHQRFNGTWTYDSLLMNVSDFKDGGSNWKATGAIPGFATTIGPRVRLSGSYSQIDLVVPAPLNLDWQGCVEERLGTHKVTDGDPANDWDPMPNDAKDMNIDLIPSSSVANSQWAPMLKDAYWARTRSGNYTTDPVSTSWEFNQPEDYCSTEARKLRSYGTSTDLVSYVNSFEPRGNTYHDVGMLWGARLLSPTGIFAGENAETANGGAIERHLIFMTDGDANTDRNNLYSFGLPTHDRRQFNGTPSNDQLTSAVEARLSAICDQVKNMNIKLWVISYGGDVNEANEDRLEECASPGHFYSASDGPALIAQFKQIASEIADLRLTQ